MSVVVVEDAERDGRKDAREVEEERRRENLLWCFDSGQTVCVVGDVVRQAAGKILADALAEPTKFLRFLLATKNDKLNVLHAGRQQTTHVFNICR